MQMKSWAVMPLLLLGALVINTALYLLVPYIQILIMKGDPGRKSPKTVVAELDFRAPPPERAVKREIKEIRTPTMNPPQPAPSRPSTPGGGLKIDLSPAGGSGLALVSGGDRTGGIGSGTGGGVGSGIAAMTYEMGQTDTDAKPVGPDPAPKYPGRAEREGVAGYVDLTFVVNEAGLVEQVTILKEEPTGYGFGVAAMETAKRIRFKPATLHKMAVRQRFKKRYNFEN